MASKRVTWIIYTCFQLSWLSRVEWYSAPSRVSLFPPLSRPRANFSPSPEPRLPSLQSSGGAINPRQNNRLIIALVFAPPTHTFFLSSLHCIRPFASPIHLSVPSVLPCTSLGLVLWGMFVCLLLLSPLSSSCDINILSYSRHSLSYSDQNRLVTITCKQPRAARHWNTSTLKYRNKHSYHIRKSINTYINTFIYPNTILNL